MSFTSMHNAYLDPDRWLNEPECVDITGKLEAYGRVGHGLCGKDADLDYGGQIRVEAAWWCEDDHIGADLSVYATICEPCQKDGETDQDYETRCKSYGELVAAWSDYPGEWSGDDWCFYLPNYIIDVEYAWPDGADEKAITDAVRVLYDAIFAAPEIVAFQSNMTELAKAGEV